MSRLQLTFACGLYDRMQALYTGEVRAEGIDLNFLAIDDPRQIFDRMGGGLEFDACEMSSSETISRLSAGNSPLVALPVFPSRVFRHGHVTINKKKGIKTPKDLEGKRIGVPLYTQTAAVFIRGFLQNDYGVDLSTIHWIQGALNQAGAHGDPSAPAPLKHVNLEQNRTGKSLSDLLDEGAIDAIAGTNMPKSYFTNPDVVRLFPNYREIEQEYFKRTKIFPIMHLIAVKRELYEKHPFIATSLFNAFNESKNRALAKMGELGALRYMLPWLQADLEEIREVFAGDPWPYGIEPNRPTLDALVKFLTQQSLIKAAIPLENIFAPVQGLH
jgi:4,5-dihydroxyphthalate decarboxylase